MSLEPGRRALAHAVKRKSSVNKAASFLARAPPCPSAPCQCHSIVLEKKRFSITKLVISPALALLSNIDFHPVKTHLWAMFYRAFTRHSLSRYLDRCSYLRNGKWTYRKVTSFVIRGARGRCFLWARTRYDDNAASPSRETGAVVSSTVKEDATYVRSKRCRVSFNLFATVKIARKSDSGTAPYIMGNNPSNIGLGKGTHTRNSNPNRSLKPLREKLVQGVDQVFFYAYPQEIFARLSIVPDPRQMRR